MPPRSSLRQPKRRPKKPRPRAVPEPEAGQPLVSILAHAKSLADALPRLHEYALQATGGVRALLFERNPRNGVFQATSGYGLTELHTDPWIPSDAERAIVAAAVERQLPTSIADLDRQMPDLAGRVDASAALLVPLARGTDCVGLLVVGFREAPRAGVAGRGATDIADAFVATLSLFRLRQNEGLERDTRELLDEFSADLSTTLGVAVSLERLCRGATRLFGADRTSVWIHERRARSLVLAATSDGDYAAGVRVAIDDPESPAAAALRQARAEVLPVLPDPDRPTTTVIVPLRGRRRALGSIVFEGVRSEVGGELDLLDRADALGRQLSGVLENVQLLEDVIRSRRELEHAFDSLLDLVVVADLRGRIVHANAAFAARLQTEKADLLDRPLSECIGPELAAWLGTPATDRPPAVARETRDVADAVLKGTFAVTVSDVLNERGDRAGRVLVARERAAP